MPKEVLDALDFAQRNWQKIGLFAVGFAGAPNFALEGGTDILLGLPAKISFLSSLPDNRVARVISHFLLRTANGYLFAALGSQALWNETSILLNKFQGLEDLTDKVPKNFVGQFHLPNLQNLQGNPLEMASQIGGEIVKTAQSIKDPFLSAWFSINSVKTGALILHGLRNFHIGMPEVNFSLPSIKGESKSASPPTKLTKFSKDELLTNGVNYLANLSFQTSTPEFFYHTLLDWLMQQRSIEQGLDYTELFDLTSEDYKILIEIIQKAAKEKHLPPDLQKLNRVDFFKSLYDSLQAAYDNYLNLHQLSQIEQAKQKPPSKTIERSSLPEAAEPPIVPPPVSRLKQRQKLTPKPTPPKGPGKFLGIFSPTSHHEVIGQPPPEIPPIGHLFQEDLKSAVDFISPIILDKNPNLSFPERIKAITYAYYQGTLYYRVLEKALAEVYRSNHLLGPQYFIELKKNCPAEFHGSKDFTEFRKRFELN